MQVTRRASIPALFKGRIVSIGRRLWISLFFLLPSISPLWNFFGCCHFSLNICFWLSSWALESWADRFHKGRNTAQNSLRINESSSLLSRGRNTIIDAPKGQNQLIDYLRRTVKFKSPPIFEPSYFHFSVDFSDRIYAIIKITLTHTLYKQLHYNWCRLSP